jgi:hypothetical protein
MIPNYPQMVADTVSKLPINKQAEVYHFAKFMKSKTQVKSNRKPKKGSVFDLFGTATSKVTDGSVNHDKYLYE